MARKKSKKRKHTGKGAYCLTVTRKRAKNARTGRGGIAFSTRCYSSNTAQEAALARLGTVGGSKRSSSKAIYTIMLHRRARGR